MPFSKTTFFLIILLAFTACQSSEQRSKQSTASNTDKDEFREKVLRNLDVEPSSYDFNDDGIQDAIRTLTSANDGGQKVIHIYMKVEDGYIPTYDGYDNEMVYPGDSIIQLSGKRFTFMYENGDHFTFEFIKDQGKWIAWQVQ